uniref:Uncharacterized protein n=1 Tax=Avena sativa TaxID=4498 RepID=A0ACD5UHN1_AVESA
MGEGNAAHAAARPSSSSSCRRGPAGGCGMALGRLVRRLRRRSKMLCTAARPAPAAASRYCHQYDPLSYARNFDFGTGLHDDDDDDVSGHLNYHYTFASRFVLPSSDARRQQQ